MLPCISFYDASILRTVLLMHFDCSIHALYNSMPFLLSRASMLLPYLTVTVSSDLFKLSISLMDNMITIVTVLMRTLLFISLLGYENNGSPH
jgi:hypothetical protein